MSTVKWEIIQHKINRKTKNKMEGRHPEGCTIDPGKRGWSSGSGDREEEWRRLLRKVSVQKGL